MVKILHMPSKVMRKKEKIRHFKEIFIFERCDLKKDIEKPRFLVDRTTRLLTDS